MLAGSIRYCAGCLARASEDGRCLNRDCHWEDEREPAVYDHLQRHSMLLNKYYIGRVLGWGGFGVTYLARDGMTGGPVAIKEYLPHGLCYREPDRRRLRPRNEDCRKDYQYGLDRFQEEAHLLTRLKHSNIVQIHTADLANNTAYMVMEYVDGQTLKQYLARQGGRIDHESAQAVMMPVMDALRVAHRGEVIHRDVSPDNILIEEKTGRVVLIDFGAARYATGEHTMNLTAVLKPGYSPPEQYEMRSNQGPRTDVYAVGATYYRAITGRVPPGADGRAVMDTLAAPSELCPGLPRVKEAALLRAMSIKAGARFGSIEEFQDALLGTVSVGNDLRPPGLHWFWVLALTGLTLGLFGWVWAFVQARWVRRVYPLSKGTIYFSFAVVSYLIAVCAVVLGIGLEVGSESLAEVLQFSGLMGLVGLLFAYAGVFDLRRSVMRYSAEVSVVGRRLSWGLTLLLGIVYLQGHLTGMGRER